MQPHSLHTNRGFLFGDAVFETVKILDSKVLFAEDHYFRLMASMRILRMEIPMDFTLEFFENIILSDAKKEQVENSSRARLTVFRKDGGLYLPKTNEVDYIISVSGVENPLYTIENKTYEVDIYKDFHVSKQLLSTLKTTNKICHITGSIFANENGLDSCILLNEERNVTEFLNGNIFMLKEGVLSTPPINEGCLNGIMRKQVLAIAKTIKNIEVKEEPVSPFDLQKADELFLTNVIKGIQPITKYRKKEFETVFSSNLLQKLNTKIRLG
ncbi:aminotransferase class IV [Flavobacterium amniphilum]|uniref:aminotransferase class IV n=1 Tax=Flavobacterium amniphilum TaxID=1834035 RepID=UPI00202AA7C6|nr:aminotransferase class IV [Flavobacterium amniphilum]MCL9806155.1 aminotransferase class IV [Flavobacterium amniphilum]